MITSLAIHPTSHFWALLTLSLTVKSTTKVFIFPSHIWTLCSFHLQECLLLVFTHLPFLPGHRKLLPPTSNFLFPWSKTDRCWCTCTNRACGTCKWPCCILSSKIILADVLWPSCSLRVVSITTFALQHTKWVSYSQHFILFRGCGTWSCHLADPSVMENYTNY